MKNKQEYEAREVLSLDKEYLGQFNLIERGRFVNKPLSEFKEKNLVIHEQKVGDDWKPTYYKDTGTLVVQELYPMYLEKTSDGPYLVFGIPEGNTVKHRYRYKVGNYNYTWRLRRAAIKRNYDYSKLTVTWR